jgi:hypothetical protein
LKWRQAAERQKISTVKSKPKIVQRKPTLGKSMINGNKAHFSSKDIQPRADEQRTY